MDIFSPGKINLALNVGELLDDGYHQVDSLFHIIELGDVVSIEPSDELKVTCSTKLDIPMQENLAYKAAKAFDAEFGTDSPLHIHIEKKLPAGGGLGGGSSNAAATLFGVACTHGIDPYDERVLKIAGELGSDVPVFLASTGAPLMTHHGEMLSEALPPATGVSVVIAWPKRAHSNTGKVYKTFDAHPKPVKSMDSLVHVLQSLKTETEYAMSSVQRAHIARMLAPELYNNLGEAALSVTPRAGEVLEFLREQPQTLAAQVSGSGACSFALCASDAEAVELAETCKEMGLSAQPTKLRSHGVSLTDGVN